MTSPILVCNNISKSYKADTPVLNDFSLSLPSGRIIGLMGPNGCGKTTLLKLICGFLTLDSGSISVDGAPISEESSSIISFLPDRLSFDNSARVRELVKTFEDFYSDFDKELACKMLADLNIDTNDKIKELSKGAQEKVQLVLAISRRAKLYLLDEPIGGVDPATRDYILKMIVKNYNPEASLIITTHIISDIEEIIDDFIFMDYGGSILMQGNADKAREESEKSLDHLFREVFKCSQNA